MTSIKTDIPCVICGQPLTVSLSKGGRSGKPCLSLKCVQDGRHFRGFIYDRAYVDGVLARLEARIAGSGSEGGE